MPRPAFTIDLLVTGPPHQVWSRLWDLDRHTAAVPLTTVRPRTPSAALGAGSRFTARTALGPVGVDDDMLVRGWDPPHHAVVDKVGRVLTGTIEVVLEPAGQDTRLRWSQSYGVTRVPDQVVALARPGVRAAYRRALVRITRP